MHGLRRSGLLAAVLPLLAANFLWAGQGVAVKLLTGRLSPLATALLPLYCVTCAGFGIFWTRQDALQRLCTAWSFRKEFFLAGICGQLVAQAGMTLGIRWSSASNGAILSLLIPIFGALLAVWLLHERLSVLRVGALLLGLAGIFLISPWHGHARSSGSVHEFAGNILVALGCLGSAFYNVYSKRLLTRFSEMEILLFSYLATTIFSAPVLFAVEPHCLAGLSRLAPAQWGALVYLAIFFYGLSMVLFLRALRTVDVVIASASLYLTPLFGVALAYGILSERLAPQAIAGTVIILLATLILFRYDTPWKKCEPVSSL